MPSRTPRVSVAMPVRDTELYLDDAMTSLTRQLDDACDLEVVVVDDGSSDATPDIAASYADRLPHQKVLRNAEPVGAATARNQGLGESTGRYITYLDGDDWYAPRHLQQVTDAIEAFDVPILRHDHVTVQEGKRRIVRPCSRCGTRCWTRGTGSSRPTGRRWSTTPTAGLHPGVRGDQPAPRGRTDLDLPCRHGADPAGTV